MFCLSFVPYVSVCSESSEYLQPWVGLLLTLFQQQQQQQCYVPWQHCVGTLSQTWHRVCVCVCSQATHIACCILSDDAHAMSCRGISNKINLIIIQWCVLTSIEPSRSAVAPVTTRLSALFTFGARLSTTVLSPVRSASVVLFLSLLALSTTYTPTSLQLTPYSRIQVNLWLT